MFPPPRSIGCGNLHSIGVTRLLCSRPPSQVPCPLSASLSRLIAHTRLASDCRAESSVTRLVNPPPSLLLDAVCDPGASTAPRLCAAVSMACVCSQRIGLSQHHYFGANNRIQRLTLHLSASSQLRFRFFALGVEFPTLTLSVVRRVPNYSFVPKLCFDENTG